MEGLLRPADVASRLGMAPNTLRVYSTRFAPLLSPSAARPAAGQEGRPGHRLYTAHDVAILERARDLVAAGMTYEQALAELRGRPGGPAAAVGPQPAAPADLAAHLATLQQAVDAWRDLAAERAREVSELRARLAAVQAELEEERRRRLAVEELARLPGREAESARDAGGDVPASAAEAGGAEPERPRPQGSWLSRLLSGEAERRGPPRGFTD